MRRLVALLVLFAVTAAASPAEAGFGIKVRGGYSYISYGGWNAWADDFNGKIPSGIPTMDNINWLPEISAEFSFPILPTFSGAVGIGYVSGKSDFSYDAVGESLSFLHKVNAMPLVFNVYWEPPLISVNPFLYGGVGFYRTSLEFDYWLTSGGDRIGYSAELDKWGFGLQAGGGVSIPVAPAMSIDVGLQGRWADVSGFDGTATNQDDETVDVYLADYEGYFGPEEKDAGEPEGSVDLSGVMIFIGVSFGF
jgi:opacity protein-like surface antigen